MKVFKSLAVFPDALHLNIDKVEDQRKKLLLASQRSLFIKLRDEVSDSSVFRVFQLPIFQDLSSEVGFKRYYFGWVAIVFDSDEYQSAFDKSVHVVLRSNHFLVSLSNNEIWEVFN